jgi:hypothetical protein
MKADQKEYGLAILLFGLGERATRRKTILALLRVIKACPAASGRE